MHTTEKLNSSWVRCIFYHWTSLIRPHPAYAGNLQLTYEACYRTRIWSTIALKELQTLIPCSCSLEINYIMPRYVLSSWHGSHLSLILQALVPEWWRSNPIWYKEFWVSRGLFRKREINWECHLEIGDKGEWFFVSASCCDRIDILSNAASC